uniref:hypothetical protein n=1 Tax=Tenacibaculum ovolyticum TaxID=104270 RepID=UPI000AB588F8
YEERENVNIYNELYTSGTLKIIQDFFMNNFNTIDKDYEEVITTETHKILEIKLKDIKKYINNIEVLNAANKLIENEFYSIDVRKKIDSDFIKISTERKYLTYKNIPTYHCLIYNPEEKNRDKYFFNEKDNWYVFSIDSPEDEEDRFLDFSPEWALPYYEAVNFFKK